MNLYTVRPSKLNIIVSAESAEEAANMINDRYEELGMPIHVLVAHIKKVVITKPQIILWLS